jgi:signal transduction histidine kinase
MNKLGFCVILVFVYFENFAQSPQILSFKAINEEQDSSYSISKQPFTLDYRKSHILISYSDLAYSANASFEIKLEGFEKKWQKVGKQTSANYINLFGGKYSFQVRNERFPEKIATVKFSIEDAFWQRAWFIPSVIAYMLLIAGIIFYFFQTAKYKQQIRLQNVRNDISADLHDDVGSTLSNISFLTEMARGKLENKPQDVPILLNKIATDTKDMILAMRGMIWSMSPNNDTCIDFFEKVQTYLKEILQPHGIVLAFDQKVAPSQKLNVEIQRNVFLICKEATNNIIKYANAKHVKVVVRTEKNWLMIQIQDDGQGFEPDPDSEGNGLRNMKHRLEQLNGTFEIKSDQGVRLRMGIPLT